MKVFTVALSLIALTDAAAVKRTASASFGPENCVALTRSAGGSCVISTDCEGADLAETEFAFDCVSKSGIVRHSFGLGGFEATETFDTEVKCTRCESPAAADVVVAKKDVAVEAPKPVAATPTVVEAPKTVPHAAVVFKAQRRHKAKVEKVATEGKAKAKFWPFDGSLAPKSEPEAVKYGPKGCVSTWKGKEGHCMISTDCKKADISKYEFGLVCVDKVGSPVRHLFGKDSFDKEETFDTLIKCDKCLGLEDIPDEVALNGEVVTMSKDIANLKDVMKNISINVQMLNNEVFKSAPGPAPAAASPAPAAAAEAAKAEKGLVQHGTEHRRTNLRHSHRRHHRDEDEDEDDEDDDDEYDDRDEHASDVQKAVVVDDVPKAVLAESDAEEGGGDWGSDED